MIAKRHLMLFCSLVFIGLISIINLYSPKLTVTSRADWTYPDGYDPHGGYLDKVTFVVYPPEDEQLGLQALQANIIYAWDERVPSDNIEELEATSGVEVTSEPGDMYRMFCIDCRHFPTNITAYRRALAYALDKGAVIQGSTGGRGYLQDCAIPIALGNWTYESQLTETYYSQDIIKANATLEAAGFRDLDGNGWRDYDVDNSSTLTAADILDEDFTIEIMHYAGHVPSQNAVMLAVEGLGKCGIMAESYACGMECFWYPVQKFPVECYTFANMVSPDLLFNLFHSSTNNNEWYFGGWTNTTYDTYAENLMAASTLDEANHWAWKCQELLWYEQPMIVCYNDVYTHAYRTDRWEGYVNMACRNRIGNGYSLVQIRLKENAGGPFGCIPTEYIMSLNQGLDTTNYLWSNSKYAKMVFQLVYDGLWIYSPYDWTPQPALAYAWETEPTIASGDIRDGEKYTFHLYENATWHDGTPVTATDVAFSFIVGLQDPYNAENYQNVYRTNIVDNKTIEIFTNTTGYIEWVHATGFTIFPAHIWSIPANISTWGPTVAELVGSGPYIFDAYVPGQYVVLQRHHDWHFAIPHPQRPPCYVNGYGWYGFLIFAGFWIIIIQLCILSVLLYRRLKKVDKFKLKE